jgi:hypothetical protein
LTDTSVSGAPWGVGRVGAGEFPYELDRVNWGAALLAIYWAALHGIWRWFFGLLGARIVWFAVWYAVDTYLPAPSPTAALIRVAVGALLLPGIDAVFAVRANRLFWKRDQSVPRLAGPTADYVGRQKTWAWVGAVLLGLGSASIVSEAVTRWPASLASVASTVGPLVVLCVLYAYDRSRRVQEPSQDWSQS